MSFRHFTALPKRCEDVNNGHDPKEPLISPINGDFHGFPPAILTSGTRDLLLSDTVRVHRKLRQAGIEAQLQVFEGVTHVAYLLGPSPESKDAFEKSSPSSTPI